jgi:hypothetical protein
VGDSWERKMVCNGATRSKRPLRVSKPEADDGKHCHLIVISGGRRGDAKCKSMGNRQAGRQEHERWAGGLVNGGGGGFAGGCYRTD